MITVGAGQVTGGPHPNFPMLVSFQHLNLRSTANGGLVTSDAGDDILLRGEDVTTCAGAQPCVLDHEIESYDPVNGTIVLWVRLPSVNNGTVIYLYYADAAVTCSQENTAGVWDSGYREVFHLNETGDYTDSTVNGFTAVAQGSVDQGVAGKVGPASDFPGNTGDARLIASDDELPANMSLPGTQSLTIEAWIRLDTLQSGQFTGFVTKGRDDGIGAPQNNWVGLFKTGTDRLSFGWPCCSGAIPNPLPANLDSTFALVTGTWYYAVATYDAVTGDRQLYVNGGAPDAADSKSAIHPVIPEYLRIGDDSNGYFHDGLIDEVRISTAVRSQSWLQTTYDNQNAPGANTRSEVLGALDQGASLLSYVGHGGPAVWASENVLNSGDPPKLLAQSEQPLMLTFNCLNGYFVAPNYDSLAEAFMKVEGRGTIGAFSPSGLSLDGPAHRFHKALMAEIVSGEHERLGDAVLAAQTAYAETGVMPELLAVYHLFGDPALRLGR